jgi:hypothetical protein
MRKYGFAILSIVILATACKNKSIVLTTPPLSDYYPLTGGKSIVYRLDSTVTTNFGVALTTHSYQVKDSIDAHQIVDGLGRNSFRIFRTFTDTLAKAPYANLATFQATPNGTDWTEYFDNNLRFMKLRFPIQEGFSWPGNSFIDIIPRTGQPDISYLANWNYTYMNVGKPDTVLGKIYPNTITVLQRNQIIGVFSSTTLQVVDYSIEVYAKGIGLIYKNFLHTEHQPPNVAHPQPYYTDETYGVKLQIISYN